LTARDEVLARYDPTREAIKRVLSLATESCATVDWDRATRQVAPWADRGALAETASAGVMVTDVAPFERNQRGRRVFDRFLSGKAKGLAAPDLALAHRIADTVRFSLFRYAGKHEQAGVWLQETLHGMPRVWLLDRSLEAGAPREGVVIGMRVFDTGEFHAGFGIVAPADPEIDGDCFDAAERGQPLPVRDSFAATLYGDALMEEAVALNEKTAATMGGILDLLDARKPAMF
jgi:hypothetical protein